MNSSSTVQFVQVTKAEFLAAVGSLSAAAPKRGKKKQVGISIGSHGRLKFTADSAQSSCLAIDFRWDTAISIDLAVLLSFLQVPPKGEVVTFSYDEGHLKIDSLTVRASEVAGGGQGRLQSDFVDWILNCPMHVRCQENWDQMQVINDSVRYCEKCGEAVHHVKSMKDLTIALKNDRCIHTSVKSGVQTISVMGLVRGREED